MRRSCLILAASLAVAVCGPAFAGFTGTDLFLPSVGAKPGVPPSVWYTTVWVHNPSATAADLTFYLLERKANVAPKHFEDTLPAGDTRRYDNAVKTMFGVETFGARSCCCSQFSCKRRPNLSSSPRTSADFISRAIPLRRRRASVTFGSPLS